MYETEKDFALKTPFAIKKDKGKNVAKLINLEEEHNDIPDQYFNHIYKIKSCHALKDVATKVLTYQDPHNGRMKEFQVIMAPLTAKVHYGGISFHQGKLADTRPYMIELMYSS